MQVREFLVVGLGGALGSILRYGISLLAKPITSFPAGTFIVNISGSFLIGLIAGWAANDPRFQQNWQLFLATVICGGFTTYSAFSLEGIQMLQQQKIGLYLFYLLSSLGAGLLLTWIGYRAIK